MRTWGIVPAAGAGSRIQPLAFSKELLPLGSRLDGEIERPRAVSEYLVERMLGAGADHICFVVSPGKSDILEYYGGEIGGAHICYTVQARPSGLCDALFAAAPLIDDRDHVLIGLPDTVWFPSNGLALLPRETLAFLLFPVAHPEFFDAVATDADGRIAEIQVKRPDATSNWIWGAFSMPGHVLHALRELWTTRQPRDEYMGTLVNAYVARGGEAVGVRAGKSYVDVGTINGYREATQLLATLRESDRETRIVPQIEIARAGAIHHPSETADDRSRQALERAE